MRIPTDVLTRLIPDRSKIVAENFQFNNIFDNSAARRDLGFEYTVPWEEGAGRMIRWLDEHGRIENSDNETFQDDLIAAWQARF